MLSKYISGEDVKNISSLYNEYLFRYQGRIQRAGNKSVKIEEFYQRDSPIDKGDGTYDSTVAGVVVSWSQPIEEQFDLVAMGRYRIEVTPKMLSVTIVDDYPTEDGDILEIYDSKVTVEKL